MLNMLSQNMHFYGGEDLERMFFIDIMARMLLLQGCLTELKDLAQKY